ncbi:MAG: hypothetical protein JW751_09665 [Polyangiaceae bacterium]|nr:hypothetical protein [Polyangiaceae bacterium]
MPSRLPPKKEVMLTLLESTSVFIHLDPRCSQVVVPPWFAKQPQLVLQVGLNMAVPIRDLNVDDECVSCSLSFNRSPFFCWIPWTSVYALVGEDGRGMVWPDDVPPEVAAQTGATTKTTSPGAGAAKSSEPPAGRRQHLRAVGSDVKVGGGNDEPPAAPPRATAEDDGGGSASVEPPLGDDGSSEAEGAAEEGGNGVGVAAHPEDDTAAVPTSGADEPNVDQTADRKRRPSWLRVVK